MVAQPSVALEELREQLHQANLRYHELRQEWEKSIDANEFRHDERVDTARTHLQEAEQAVEVIEERINQTLRVSPVDFARDIQPSVDRPARA